MSRNAHLTPDEEDRILRLGALGMPTSTIARNLNRSRNLVWRVLTGRRHTQVWRDKHNLPQSAAAALETLFAVRLETRRRFVGVSKEADMLTADNPVRSLFIDTLLEHFKGGRRPSERALADLKRELVCDGYDEQVLDRAARDMIRTRYAKGFPSVAECLAACRVAQGQQREAEQRQVSIGDGADMASALLPESRPCQQESEAGPGKARAESRAEGCAAEAANAANARAA